MGNILDLDSKGKLYILHIDMDAFYASVEERDNPDLKGKPVIVGGLSNHGIVTTANYEARKYGVHSAMPIFIAKIKCPHGYYIPPRMERYREISRRVFYILYGITEIIEQVSIDEAYLDISQLDGDPIMIAQDIKRRVLKETGLTMSIGISYNKFLAKLASDWNKPNGIKIISQDMVPDILLPLSVKSVHGIGPKSAKKLNNIGIYTVKDLMYLTEDFLVDLFGKQGGEIYYRIRGIDNREIDTERERKSLGTETTFSKDTRDKGILKSYIGEFASEISGVLRQKGLHGRTITLKIKYDDFTVKTRGRTLVEEVDSEEILYKIGVSLLDEMDLRKKVRLIGLTVSNLSPSTMEQLSLFNN